MVSRSRLTREPMQLITAGSLSVSYALSRHGRLIKVLVVQVQFGVEARRAGHDVDEREGLGSVVRVDRRLDMQSSPPVGLEPMEGQHLEQFAQAVYCKKRAQSPAFFTAISMLVSICPASSAAAHASSAPGASHSVRVAAATDCPARAAAISASRVASAPLARRLSILSTSPRTAAFNISWLRALIVALSGAP